MPRYPNGQWPESVLIIFNRGRTVHRLSNGGTLVEDWYQGLTPGTYAKHLALVALAARNNNGRRLRLSDGFSCYRPIYGQQIARTLYGIGAAKVGTSSHGGFWENRETLAMDYGNWSDVYQGDRARFYADCRAVGLTPGMIEPRRGYPDEPWHVIDLAPWAPAPAGLNATPFQEDDMSKPTIIAYASATDRNGIVLAAPGSWHKFTGEEWTHLNDLKGSDGKSYLAEIPVLTPINDRSYDLLKAIFTNNEAEKGGGMTAAQVQEVVDAVRAAGAQVDAATIAKAVNDDAAERMKD